MEHAGIPDDEEERLETVRRLGLLDTEAEERFDRVTRLAQRLFGASTVMITLIDDHRAFITSSRGFDATESARATSFCGHVVADDDILVVEDAHLDPRFSDNPNVTGDPFVRFYAGCPLRVSPDVSPVGTLCLVDSKPRSMSADDLEMLRDLASTVEHELRALRLATTDDLTGLANRRALLELGEVALAAAARHDLSFSLVFVDLDGLKAINDYLGHDAGDRAIAAAANLLRTATRDTDLVARFGGDEFCVLLIGVEETDLSVLLARIDALAVVHDARDDAEFPLSLSCGAVTYDPRRDAGLEDLLARGDASMYEVKRARRSSRDPSAASM